MQDYATATFAKHDADGNGVLDLSELHAALHDMGHPNWSRDDAAQIMENYSTSSSVGRGKLDQPTFLRLVHDLSAFERKEAESEAATARGQALERSQRDARRARLSQQTRSASQIPDQLPPDARGAFSAEVGDDAAPLQLSQPHEFYFLDAEVLRNVSMEEFPKGLPRMQDLMGRGGATPWLVRKSMTMHDAIAGRYREAYCTVSHRWEQPGLPDADRVQFEAIRQHAIDNQWIHYIWFDFWCMPQKRPSADGEESYDDRSPDHKSMFKRMLPNVNILYLACHVLCLVDLSYQSRFWTQFEMWLALQEVSPRGYGLMPAQERRRLKIKLLHGATPSVKTVLLEMWQEVTPEEAVQKLAGNDIVVTNKSDKDQQLSKLLELNTLVK